MATTIVTKHENGDANDAPVTLSEGELAVNTQAQKLWVGPIGGGTPVPLISGGVVEEGTNSQTLRYGTVSWEATSDLVVLDNGHVGIGTDAPERRLHVRGGDAGVVQSGSTYQGIFEHNSDCIVQLRAPDADNTRLYFGNPSNFAGGSIGRDGATDEFSMRSTGEIAFFANGTALERMRINSVGNVGIGTSDPQAKLEISSADGVDSLQFQAGVSGPGISDIFCAKSAFGVGNLVYTGASHRFASNNGEHMRILNDGNVGIGLTAPTSRLHVVKSTPSGSLANASANTFVLDNSDTSGLSILTPNNRQGRIWFGDPENSGRGQINYEHTDDSMRFATAAGERMRIDSSGNVLIGVTTAGATLHVQNTLSGTGTWLFRATSGAPGTYQFGVRNDGSLVAQNIPTGTQPALGVSSGGFIQQVASSIRFKKNVQDYGRGIADIMAMRPVTFEHITDDVTHAGFIAEEVEAAGLTEYVFYEEDGTTPKSLNYANMVALMAKGIQELTARIEQLEA